MLNALIAKVVVCAVETIGDWMRLSIVTITFAFWLIAVNAWDVPIPTDVKSKTFGVKLKASSALLANLIPLSFTFTI